MAQQPPINLDLSSATDITCDSCGNYTFEQVLLMKKMSALVSPTGKEAIVPIPTYSCNACGFINKQFLPVKLSDDQQAHQDSLATPPERTRLSLEK